MDSEAPKYAKWINEAGGYVADGQVLSTTPQYDANGRLVDVDVSQFTQPQTAQPTLTGQSSTPITQQAAKWDPVAGGYVYNGQIVSTIPQLVEGKLIDLDMSQANKQGSGTDANAMATQIGSAGSFGTNTATTGSAISSPATQSHIANVGPLSTMDQINQQYQAYVAEGNLKGQIDMLTKAMQLDGVDRTAEINNLWKARGDKIRRQDDAYLQAINEAKAIGDATGNYAQYNQLIQEQQAYRDSVGYQDQLNRDYQMQQQDLQLDYESAYMTGINDITKSILQLTGNVLNFQYDPMSDMNLQRAQAEVQLRMKNQFNATGMYYSTATQYAITQAIANLVPVYEKMAKDELRENISLLQNTASYLINLDEYQFNQWKTRIQLQWQANEQKQKKIEDAIANANVRGYYTNEEAALVGVEPGSESYAARERAIAKQDEIDKEKRKLDQDKKLAEYKNGLEIQKMREQNKLNKDYYRYQLANPKPTSSGSTTNPEGVTLSNAITTAKLMLSAGASDDQVKDYLVGTGLNGTQLETAWLQAKANQIVDKNKDEEERKKKDDEARKKLDQLSIDERNGIADLDVATEINNYKKNGDKSDKGKANFVDSIVGNYSEDDAIQASASLSKDVIADLEDLSTKYNDDFGNNLDLVNKGIEEIKKESAWLNKTKTYTNAESDKAALWRKLVDGVFGELVYDDEGTPIGVTSAKENLDQFDFEFADMFWENFGGTQDAAKKHILDAIEKEEKGTSGFVYQDIENAIDVRLDFLKGQNKKPVTNSTPTPAPAPKPTSAATTTPTSTVAPVPVPVPKVK